MTQLPPQSNSARELLGAGERAMTELPRQSNVAIDAHVRHHAKQLRDEAMKQASRAVDRGSPVAAAEWLEVARRAVYVEQSVRAMGELTAKLEQLGGADG
jgi:hypothetical protein